MTKNSKIKDLDELAILLASEHAAGKSIVQCHGVFELLHIGQLRYFEQARAAGDVLVATLVPDSYVDKGPHRSAFPEEFRAEVVAALECVDFVAINKWPTAVEAIRLLKPTVLARGPDQLEKRFGNAEMLRKEELAARAVGSKLLVTEGITINSSNMLNTHLFTLPEDLIDYLAGFGARYGSEQVLKYLENARSLRVLLVGEAIIDEYQYCETIGKSGKEPILAARYVSSEKFAGGILAVANHVAAFCDQVGVLTVLGAEDSQEDFILEKMDPRINKMLLYQQGAPTIVKRRIVETYPFQKLFEVYVMNGDANRASAQDLCAKLEQVLPEYDVVIVTDYGHGMLGTDAVRILCEQARFLGVNTQVNAENRGFNTVSKYRCANYICISENEIRLEARSRRRDLREIVLEVADRLSCERILVTRGAQGCLCYDGDEGFFEVPAFVGHVVDRVGAGDAVLSVTTLCVAQGAPMEVVGFISNAVGAQAVATVGNRTSIQSAELLEHIESFLR